MAHEHHWRPGPLPPNTCNWGGVVKKGDEGKEFNFADFHGDHVILTDGERVEAADVAFFNNCLELPPCCTMRAGSK